MKKILIALALVLYMSSGSYADVSNDIYVRKDVFDLHLQNINTKLDRIINELQSQRQELNAQRQELQTQRQALNDLTKSVAVLSERIEGVNSNLSAKIDGVDSRLSACIDGLGSRLSERIDGLDSRLSERIDGLDSRLSERIDGLDSRLSARIDGLENRIGDLRNDIYLGLVLLGIIVALPSIQKYLQIRDERRASRNASTITLEQIEELINAKFRENARM